ncbi:MAG: hydantoinase/oxoprolinase family protein [Angustibacter sp.]
MTNRIRIGIDTGGTFTDVVAVDEHTGAVLSTKTPSTPDDPARGLLAGIDAILDLLGLDLTAVTAVSHGTTVATNRLLEGPAPGLGLVTTEGYRHILEIARQAVPDGYGNSYFWVKPPRIVPADRVRTVRGRLAVDGSEVRPFDEDDAVAAARFLRDRGVTAVGVCFLHAYANPAHERAMRDVLRREHPDAVVSLSSEVLREYREYERTVTTLVDAAVKPAIRGYVRQIADQLAERTGAAGRAGPIPFSVMTSGGGVLSAAQVAERPITTVLSGPAAGALGAAVVARAAGVDRVLTCDGGGTSTDVAVVVDGRPAITTEATIGGYPAKIPMIDVATVGAGGGSVAWIAADGALRVGPRSVGAAPGPACYGRGGTEPTVTDAHLVLGRIPAHLLGGRVPLDVAAARSAIGGLAERTGQDEIACARGVLEISAWNQANALRRISVQRGLDARDFTLVTFGGSGSLLACRLIDVLGVAGVLVPADPGNLSAFGLLTVDVRTDTVRTLPTRGQRDGVALVTSVRAGYDELHAETDAALEREGFAAPQRVQERTADLRYSGQASEVRVPVPVGELDDAALGEVVRRFHAEHRALYGYDLATDPRQRVEWVNLRVTGIGPIRTPRLPVAPIGSGARGARTGSRLVWFDDDSGGVGGGTSRQAEVYDRARLGAGDVVAGPAVVEEFGSTVPVHPGYRAEVDRHRNLLLTRTAADPPDADPPDADPPDADPPDASTQAAAGTDTTRGS